MSVFRSLLAGIFSAAALAALGCHGAPGKPGPGPEVPRPDQVLDFASLYKQNCVACHGDDRQPGAAISLANPVFLAVAGEENLKMFTANGMTGKLMPAFAHSAGGMLTDRQVDILAKGMIAAWGKPGLLDGENPPPFAATLTSDSAADQQPYATYCARCHGANGEGNAALKVGSIVALPFVALISDQELRNFVIAGAPGMPDWRSDVPGHPMTDREITDVVAWVASHRESTLPAKQFPMPAPNQSVKSSKVKNETSSTR